METMTTTRERWAHVWRCARPYAGRCAGRLEITRTPWGALCARDTATGEAWAYHHRSDRAGARWMWRACRRLAVVVRWVTAAD